MEHRLLAFVVRYSYVGLFGSMALGMLGLPIPDEVLMTYSGYLISTGKMNYIATILTAVSGGFIGMSFSYAVGRRFGYPLLDKYGAKIHITRDKLARTEAWFKRFGKWALPVGYFIPGVRHWTAYLAGIGRWTYRSFALYAGFGAVVWAVFFVTMGTLLGNHWREVAHAAHRYMLALGVGVVVAAAAWWLIRRRLRAKAAR